MAVASTQPLKKLV